MKFILLTWLGLFIWGVIYSCKNMSSINYTITKKKPHEQSPNLEGVDDYMRTYTFLGGKR
jgi:hypothetical protein